MRNVVETKGDNGQNRFTGRFGEGERCVEAVKELWGKYSSVRSITSLLLERRFQSWGRMQKCAPRCRCLVRDSFVSTNACDSLPRRLLDKDVIVFYDETL